MTGQEYAFVVLAADPGFEPPPRKVERNELPVARQIQPAVMRRVAVLMQSPIPESLTCRALRDPKPLCSMAPRQQPATKNSRARFPSTQSLRGHRK